MAGGFAVDIEALRRAADVAAEASETAGGLRLAEAMELIAAALPESRTEQRAAVMRSALRRWLTAWCADAEAYEAKLNATADRYVAADDRSRLPFSRYDGRLSPR